jgi:hypothetical protein
MLIEPLVFSQIKSDNDDHNQVSEDSNFKDKVQVLLIVYLNMGNSQLKLGNLKYANVVLEHGWKMARKILGHGSYFEQKFFKMINSNFGDELQKFTKSTNLSYIENHDKMIEPKNTTKYRPTSKREVKIVSRNTNNQTYAPQNIEIEHTPSSRASMRVINKSNKRKIFMGDSQDSEVKSASVASEHPVAKDNKQLSSSFNENVGK